MIEANELRLNNWVYSLEVGSNVQITLLSNDNWLGLSSVTWDQPSFEEIEPIPLTEEILLKCGFIEFGQGFIHDKMRYSDVFKIREDGYIVYVSNNVYITKVMYLHQLQNLYWCLCGKELEINL